MRRGKHLNKQEMILSVFVLVDGRWKIMDKDYYKKGWHEDSVSLGIVTGGRNNLPKMHTHKWTEKQTAKLSSHHNQLLQIQWPKSSYFHHMRHTNAFISIKTRALNSDQLSMTEESQQVEKNGKGQRERERGSERSILSFSHQGELSAMCLMLTNKSSSTQSAIYITCTSGARVKHL